MAIIKSLDVSDVIREAEAYGRLDQFGTDGWRAIADYLAELSHDTGDDIEIDIIGICCAYDRFDNADDVISSYGLTDHIDFADMDDDEKHKAVMEWLRNNTAIVSDAEECIIVQQF